MERRASCVRRMIVLVREKFNIAALESKRLLTVERLLMIRCCGTNSCSWFKQGRASKMSDKPSVSMTPESDGFAARYDRMVEKSGAWVFKSILLIIAFVVVVGLILQSNS